MKKVFVVLAALVVFAAVGFGWSYLEASSGCCSSHGGVAGCSFGRVMCNDGTASPTCRCNADDLKIDVQ